MIAGSHCADIAADAANSSVPFAIHELVETIIRHEDRERNFLVEQCFSYLDDVSRKRCQLVDALKEKPTSHLLRPRQELHRDACVFDSYAIGIDVLECLIKFNPQNITLADSQLSATMTLFIFASRAQTLPRRMVTGEFPGLRSSLDSI